MNIAASVVLSVFTGIVVLANLIVLFGPLPMTQINITWFTNITLFVPFGAAVFVYKMICTEPF